MKLVTADTMRRLDRIAVRGYGIRGVILMENAGKGVADIVKRELSRIGGRRVAIIAGKGNNGGDGFVCARHLKNSGYEVLVFTLSDPDGIKGDAGANALIWKKMDGGIYPIRSSRELKKHVLSLRHSSIIVDGILGTGIARPASGVYAAVIDLINKLGKPVVSIDIPSGMDGSTGKVLGRAVSAAVTATFAFAKAGFFVYPGRSYAGRVEIIDIGIPVDAAKGVDIRHNLIDGCMVSALLKPRKKDTHKGTYGHVLVIGGSIGKTGAVYMAGMGAMRAGAGLATIALPQSLNPIMEVKTTEVMTHPLPEKDGRLGEFSYHETEKILDGKSALVFGPGLGGGVSFDYVKKTIFGCAGKNIPLIIDADGLNALKGNIAVLRDAAKKGGKIIVTPHPGEMARLLNMTAKQVQDDRIGSALKLFQKTGCVTVLKGASTLVVSEDGVFINPTGNPGMATAGTGDVMAGMLGGFISQGLRCEDAAVAAVYLHGLSGDEVAKERGETGIIATDLLSAIPKVLNSFVRGDGA